MRKVKNNTASKVVPLGNPLEEPGENVCEYVFVFVYVFVYVYVHVSVSVLCVELCCLGQIVEASSDTNAQINFSAKKAKDSSTHLIAYSFQRFPQVSWS